MGTRGISALAILGGTSLTAAIAAWALVHPADPESRTYQEPVVALFGIVGILGLSLSLGGLGNVLVNRYESMVGFVAFLGTVGGIGGLLRAYWALALLPAASVVVVLYLARIRAIPWSLAFIHAVSAPGLVIGLAAYSDRSLTGAATAFTLFYGLTWIGIGLELLHGLPQARPAEPASSPEASVRWRRWTS